MQTDRIAATCSGLVKIYYSGTSEVHALKGIDAAFPDEALTAVVGPSGSGKSSLLRILAAMDRPTAGRVSVAGAELTSMTERRLRKMRDRTIAYVYQRPAHNVVSYLTVDEHMKAAARGGDGPYSADDALDAVGIAHRKSHRPHQLSGGEQQRLAFGQALVRSPAIVIADEPTAALDRQTARALVETMRSWTQSGMCFIVSTHDPEVVEAADQTIYLRHGALEAEARDMGAFSVIDEVGRIQLPPSALKMFPQRRAVIKVEDDEIRITPP